MKLAITAGLAVALASCATVAPVPAPAVVEKLERRAQAANFDGLILVGEANGTHRVIPVGADPVRPDAIWRWASITKQLAAVLVMQEVARKRIDLEATVSRYWPEWRSPGATTVRIRDLLRHNSGLPQPDSSPLDADGIPSFYGARSAPPDVSANAFCAGPLRASAPAPFDYNNCDSIVLGEVLRRVTGKSFDMLVAERFARPLGMDSFGMFRYGVSGPAQVRPIGEDSGYEGKFDLGLNGPAAGAYGTIEDLWRFDRALLSGRLLPPAQREAMWQGDKSNTYYAFHQWAYSVKLSGCTEPTRVIERQGLVAGIEHRNYLLPESGRALILFARKKPAGYGDPLDGEGFAFDMLSFVACRS